MLIPQVCDMLCPPSVFEEDGRDRALSKGGEEMAAEGSALPREGRVPRPAA